MRFASYDLLGRLATGGSAHIFLAGQRGVRGFERLVCVKTLVPERAKDEDAISSFIAEAEIASHFHHPNCVGVFGVGQERGAYFMSMEYIAGETLANLLATWNPDRPLPAPEMISILSAVCDGLHYAHELCAPDGHAYNLIHRDISPPNVMISYAGHVKVLDFGIAKGATQVHRAETRVGVVKGKVRYMSPEQILSGPLDRRSDIYSLGLVMFECLTGRTLFENCSPAQIQYKMLHERLPRVRDYAKEVDAQLDAICFTALQFDANARYPTAYVMGRELRSYLKRIGFPGGRDAVAALMRERYGERTTQRSEFVERVLNNQCDEAEIRAALGARPVLSVDLFGEGSTARDAFDEDATLLDPAAMVEPLGGEITIDELEPPPALSAPVLPPPPPLPALTPVRALPVVAATEAEEFVDQTRMLDDDTRPLPDTKKVRAASDPPVVPVAAVAGVAPVTAIVPVASVETGVPHRTAALLALLAFALGLGLGIAATLLAVAS